MILFRFSVTVATSIARAATCWWTSRSQIQTCSSSEPWNPGDDKPWNPGTPGDDKPILLQWWTFKSLQSWNLEMTNQPMILAQCSGFHWGSVFLLQSLELEVADPYWPNRNQPKTWKQLSARMFWTLIIYNRLKLFKQNGLKLPSSEALHA